MLVIQSKNSNSEIKQRNSLYQSKTKDKQHNFIDINKIMLKESQSLDQLLTYHPQQSPGFEKNESLASMN